MDLNNRIQFKVQGEGDQAFGAVYEEDDQHYTIHPLNADGEAGLTAPKFIPKDGLQLPPHSDNSFNTRYVYAALEAIHQHRSRE